MTTEDAQWIEVSVSEIRRSHGDDEEEWQRKFVMVLAERDTERTLPIWIGPAEAISLAMEQSAETPRPFTYKLAADLVGAAGAKVAEGQDHPPDRGGVLRLRARRRPGRPSRG
jgi:bifunctional DNase/RNase